MKGLAILFALSFLGHEGASIHAKGDQMSTKETVEKYFNALKQMKGWEDVLADDMEFTSFTSPVKRVAGKSAYLQATKRFYGSIVAFELRGLMVAGDRVCAQTHYELQGPGGNRFSSDVAELFTVRDGKIVSFDIYFDATPFPK